jgi:hypothetical protein
MTSHADLGAAIIKNLLEEPSVKLEEDMEALQYAMGQVDPETGAITDAQPPIARVRTFYAALAGRIREVSTAEAEGARRLALTGLKQMDSGLGQLASVVAQNAAASAEKEIEAAVRQMEQGSQALARAARSID